MTKAAFNSPLNASDISVAIPPVTAAAEDSIDAAPETPSVESIRSNRALQAFQDLAFDLRNLPTPTQCALPSYKQEQAKKAAEQISALYQTRVLHSFLRTRNSDNLQVIAPNVFCLPNYLALDSHSKQDIGRLQATGDFQLVLAPLDSKDPLYGILLKYGVNQYFLAGGRELFSLDSKDQVLTALQIFSEKNGLHYVQGPSLIYSLALAGILKAHLDAQKVPLHLEPLQSVAWRQEETRKSISHVTPRALKNPRKDPRIDVEEAFTNADVGIFQNALIRENQRLQKMIAGLMEQQKRFQIPEEAWMELGTKSLVAAQDMITQLRGFYRLHTKDYPRVYEKMSFLMDHFEGIFKNILAKKRARRQRFSEQGYAGIIARFVEDHLALLQTYHALAAPSPSADASIPPQQASKEQTSVEIPASFFADLSREELEALERAMQALFPQKRTQRSSSTFIDKNFEGKVPPQILNFLKRSNAIFITMVQGLLAQKDQSTQARA